MKIVNRKRELETLARAAKQARGQLVLVWGRRRVGKTFLLQAFSEARRAVSYTATQQSALVELAAFTHAVRSVLGAERLPSGYAFPDWSTALEFVATNAGRRRLVVILDEFPYLAASSPGIESVVQRWWDAHGRQSQVMLILCGSAVAYMRQIENAASPLHQRATASIQVHPLDYRSAADFFPRLDSTRCAVVYGILGGTALYLQQWDGRASVRRNLVRLFGDPASPLVDAGELVLSGELPELEGACRILQAVALGRTRPSAIADYAKVAVERPLKRLTMLGLLERQVPAVEDPARSKRAIYRILDPYFSFWFRFIASNRPQISRGLGEQLVDSRIVPFLDDYMGRIFEEMAREHARALASRGAISASRVDAWWSHDGAQEVDLVGVSGSKHISFVGSVKWSSRPLGRSALENLQKHASALPGYEPSMIHFLYGRSGCGARLSRETNVRCFSIHDMYR